MKGNFMATKAMQRDKATQERLDDVFNLQSNALKQRLLYGHYTSGELPFSSLNEIQIHENELATATTFNISFQHLLDNDLYLENVYYEKQMFDLGSEYFAITDIDDASELNSKDIATLLRVKADMVLGVASDNAALFAMGPKKIAWSLPDYGNTIDTTYDFTTLYDRRRLLKLDANTIYVQRPTSTTDREFKKIVELVNITGVYSTVSLPELDPDIEIRDLVENEFRGRLALDVGDDTMWATLNNAHYFVATNRGLFGYFPDQPNTLQPVVFTNTRGIVDYRLAGFHPINEEPTLILVAHDGTNYRQFYVSLAIYPLIFDGNTIRELVGVHLDGVDGAPTPGVWTLRDYGDSTLALLSEGGFLQYSNFMYGFPTIYRVFTESKSDLASGGISRRDNAQPDLPFCGAKRYSIARMAKDTVTDVNSSLCVSNQGLYWKKSGTTFTDGHRVWDFKAVTDNEVTDVALEDIVAITEDLLLFNAFIDKEDEKAKYLFGVIKGVSGYKKCGDNWMSSKGWGFVQDGDEGPEDRLKRVFDAYGCSMGSAAPALLDHFFDIDEDNLTSRIAALPDYNTFVAAINAIAPDSFTEEVQYHNGSATQPAFNLIIGTPANIYNARQLFVKDSGEFKWIQNNITNSVITNALGRYVLTTSKSTLADIMRQHYQLSVLGAVASSAAFSDLIVVNMGEQYGIVDNNVVVGALTNTEMRSVLEQSATRLLSSVSLTAAQSSSMAKVYWTAVKNTLLNSTLYKACADWGLNRFNRKFLGDTSSFDDTPCKDAFSDWSSTNNHSYLPAVSEYNEKFRSYFNTNYNTNPPPVCDPRLVENDLASKIRIPLRIDIDNSTRTVVYITAPTAAAIERLDQLSEDQVNKLTLAEEGSASDTSYVALRLGKDSTDDNWFLPMTTYVNLTLGYTKRESTTSTANPPVTTTTTTTTEIKINHFKIASSIEHPTRLNPGIAPTSNPKAPTTVTWKWTKITQEGSGAPQTETHNNTYNDITIGTVTTSSNHTCYWQIKLPSASNATIRLPYYCTSTEGDWNSWNTFSQKFWRRFLCASYSEREVKQLLRSDYVTFASRLSEYYVLNDLVGARPSGVPDYRKVPNLAQPSLNNPGSGFDTSRITSAALSANECVLHDIRSQYPASDSIVYNPSAYVLQEAANASADDIYTMHKSAKITIQKAINKWTGWLDPPLPPGKDPIRCWKLDQTHAIYVITIDYTIQVKGQVQGGVYKLKTTTVTIGGESVEIAEADISGIEVSGSPSASDDMIRSDEQIKTAIRNSQKLKDALSVLAQTGEEALTLSQLMSTFINSNGYVINNNSFTDDYVLTGHGRANPVHPTTYNIDFSQEVATQMPLQEGSTIAQFLTDIASASLQYKFPNPYPKDRLIDDDETAYQDKVNQIARFYADVKGRANTNIAPTDMTVQKLISYNGTPSKTINWSSSVWSDVKSMMVSVCENVLGAGAKIDDVFNSSPLFKLLAAADMDSGRRTKRNQAHATIMDEALIVLNKSCAKQYVKYDALEHTDDGAGSAQPRLSRMYHLKDGKRAGQLFGVQDRKVLMYAEDTIIGDISVKRRSFEAQTFDIKPDNVKVLPFEPEKTSRRTWDLACESGSALVYWVKVPKDNSYGIPVPTNQATKTYPYIDESRLKGILCVQSEEGVSRTISAVVYAVEVGKLFIALTDSADIYCFNVNSLTPDNDLVYRLNPSQNCTVYKTMYSGRPNMGIDAMFLLDWNEADRSTETFDGKYQLLVQFKADRLVSGESNLQRFTFTTKLEDEPYGAMALSNVFSDANLTAAYRQFSDTVISDIQQTDDGLVLFRGDRVYRFVDGYAQVDDAVLHSTFLKAITTADPVYTSYYLDSHLVLTCLNTSDSMSELYPYTQIDLCALVPELKDVLEGLIVYDIDMTSWSSSSTLSYIVVYTNKGVYLIDMGLTPSKLRFEDKQDIIDYFTLRAREGLGAHLTSKHHDRMILSRFNNWRRRISENEVYDFATLTTNTQYTSPTELHGGYNDNPYISVTVDKQVFGQSSLVCSADKNPGVVFAAVSSPLTKYDNTWQKMQIASPLVETQFYDYFYRRETAPNGAQLLTHILNLNHLPFIYRQNTDHTWDMWIDIPSTMTVYMNRIVGSTLNVKGGRTKVEGNVAKIRKNLNNAGTTADPNEQATTVRLYINTEHFHMDTIREATISGASLPLYIYRDYDANDGLFDGVQLQSVWNRQIETVTDKHGIQYTMLEFKVWGADEQCVHLRGETAKQQ